MQYDSIAYRWGGYSRRSCGGCYANPSLRHQTPASAHHIRKGIARNEEKERWIWGEESGANDHALQCSLNLIGGTPPVRRNMIRGSTSIVTNNHFNPLIGLGKKNQRSATRYPSFLRCGRDSASRLDRKSKNYR